MLGAVAHAHGGSRSLFSFECEAPVALRPVSFTLSETLSEPYEARVLVRTDELSDQLHGLVLGRPARLSFGGEGTGRTVRGIVRSVESRGLSSSVVGAPAYAELTIVPKLALLSSRKASRIFQDVSVMDVVDQILAEWGIPRRWALRSMPASWPYNVQHQESDLDYLKRILAAEGIFFFFEEGPAEAGVELYDGVRVVLGDSSSAYGAEGGRAIIPELYPATRQDRSASAYDRLYHFAQSRSLAPAFVMLRDYSAMHAHADNTLSAGLNGSSFDTISSLRTHYEYLPARPIDGNRAAASVAIEQLSRDAHVYSGEAGAPGLQCGHPFRVERQSDPSLDGTYVPTSLLTRGHDPAYGTRPELGEDTLHQQLRAVRATDVFRPARIHRDVHHGFDTAVVVGPPGVPVVSDALGRVRVRFSWDHERPGIDDANVDWSRRSTWLRVAQPWSGAGHGAFFLPRVGSEVLVGYIGGDINRPVIVGALPNSVQPPPFSLPHDSGKSGIVTRGLSQEGHSELVFDDTGGRESARLESQRKLELRARQDIEVRAGRSETTDVHEASLLRVGRERREEIGGERIVSVGALSVFESGNARLAVSEDTRVELGTASIRARDEATLTFEARAEWQYRSDVRVDVAGVMAARHEDTLFVNVGTKERSASHLLHVEGTSTHETTETLEITSDKEIVLRSGKSTVRISPEAVQIDTPKLRVDADAVDLVGEEMQVQGRRFVRLEGAKVFALSSGAGLSLTAMAKLNGSMVKLGTPPDESDGPEAKRAEPPPTTIRLVDQDGAPIAHERCLVRLSDGTTRAAVTDAEGVARLYDLQGAATVDFIDLSKWEKH